MNIDQLTSHLKEKLSPSRLRHSLGVARTAVALAERYGAEVYASKLAGLLHDYARDLPTQTLLEIAEKANLVSHLIERQVPDLLHGPVAAWLVRTELGISDPYILHAIKVHTVAAENMSLLDKIIYIADLIEPGRDYPGVEKLRALARIDLDRALLAGYNQTIRYCIERDFLLHPQTIKARNQLLASITLKVNEKKPI